ncbi:MAG: AAA family ATPase [Verrucomicrobia bacterium]|nr:AAA family ATPase [Verrucomicrobiota bacterium]MBI3870621.1 AAA family ATPase [Verrucomicrobiota bacterium]
MSTSSSPSTPDDSDASAIVRYRRILFFLKTKWWIPLCLALLGGGIHAFYLLSTPGDYTAVARMWVGGRVRIPESSFFTEEWQNFFGTQIELMQSEKIRMRALTAISGKKPDSSQPLRKLDVTQPRKTTIFNLSMQGTDPEFLAAYLNSVMEEYLRYKKEVRATSSDDTVASLGEQLEKVENELKGEQERIADFQRTNNLSVLQGAAISAGNQLARLHLQLGDLQLEHDTLELTSPEENLERRAVGAGSLVNRSSEGGSSSIPTDYLAARQQRELKRFEQTQKGSDLLPEHPTMVKLAEDIARIDAVMELLRKQSQDDLDEARRRAQLKIKAVTDAIKALEPKVAEMNQKLAEHDRNKASLDRVAAQQTRLLQAMHNVGVNKSVDQESVSVMERAVVFPTPRRIAYNAGLSSLVAVILGLGIALLVERIDQRVMTPAEARAFIPVRVLGCVPRMSQGRSQERTARIRVGDSSRLWTEAFRRLRIAITSNSPLRDQPGRVLLVASSTPGEGKTLVAANLARSLASAGFSVLLIDGDIHRRELTQVFSQSSRPGLSDLAETLLPIEQLVIAADVPRLFMMGVGLEPEALERQTALVHFRDRMRDLRNRFDYVILDSAPVLAASEACSLAGMSDHILFVVRMGSTRLASIEQALDQLRLSGAALVGLVLNQAHPRSSGFSFETYEGYSGPAPTPRSTAPPSAVPPPVLKPDVQLAKG